MILIYWAENLVSVTEESRTVVYVSVPDIVPHISACHLQLTLTLMLSSILYFPIISSILFLILSTFFIPELILNRYFPFTKIMFFSVIKYDSNNLWTNP